MTDTTIPFTLFKHGSKEFFELVVEAKIPFQANRGVEGPQAASHTVEIVTALGGLSLLPAIAMVVVQWLKNKSSREVMIQSKDNEVIHLKGQDATLENVQKALDLARSAAVIQTKPDDDA